MSHSKILSLLFALTLSVQASRNDRVPDNYRLIETPQGDINAVVRDGATYMEVPCYLGYDEYPDGTRDLDDPFVLCEDDNLRYSWEIDVWARVEEHEEGKSDWMYDDGMGDWNRVELMTSGAEYAPSDNGGISAIGLILLLFCISCSFLFGLWYFYGEYKGAIDEKESEDINKTTTIEEEDSEYEDHFETSEQQIVEENMEENDDFPSWEESTQQPDRGDATVPRIV